MGIAAVAGPTGVNRMRTGTIRTRRGGIRTVSRFGADRTGTSRQRADASAIGATLPARTSAATFRGSNAGTVTVFQSLFGTSLRSAGIMHVSVTVFTRSRLYLRIRTNRSLTGTGFASAGNAGVAFDTNACTARCCG